MRSIGCYLNREPMYRSSNVLHVLGVHNILVGIGDAFCVMLGVVIDEGNGELME